jgi:hypothetical protein
MTERIISSGLDVPPEALGELSDGQEPLSRPNVFHAKAIVGDEDRFTAHWHYLLDCYPELAQQVLNRIADSCGLDRTKYRGAQDHPWFTVASRPDFVLRGETYDILCEHKLDAGLGALQLERYCALAVGPRPAYVVLIGKTPIAVPGVLLESSAYRAPKTEGTQGGIRGHFLWEDFHDLVAKTPGRLAADFLAYMNELGLEPWRWGGVGDPFTSEEARDQFRRIWVDIIPRLRRPGSVVKADPVGLGLQYQHPMPEVDLVWVGPYRVLDSPSDPRVGGRAMVVRVWQHARGDAPRNLLNDSVGDGAVPVGATCGIQTFVRAPMTNGRTIGVLSREYYTPLVAVMGTSWPETQRIIGDWLDAILAHLALDVGEITT